MGSTIDELRARFKQRLEEPEDDIMTPESPRLGVDWAQLNVAPLTGAILNPFEKMRGCPDCREAYPELNPEALGPVSFSSHRDTLQRVTVYTWACDEGHTGFITITDAMVEAFASRNGLSVMNTDVGVSLFQNEVRNPSKGFCKILVNTKHNRATDEPSEGDTFQLPLTQNTVLVCEVTSVKCMDQDGAHFYRCEWNQADERQGICTIMAGYVISWAHIEGGQVVCSSRDTQGIVGITGADVSSTIQRLFTERFGVPLTFPIRVCIKKDEKVMIKGMVYGPEDGVVEIGSDVLNLLVPGFWEKVHVVGHGLQVAICVCNHEVSLHNRPKVFIAHPDRCLYTETTASEVKRCPCVRYVENPGAAIIYPKQHFPDLL